ncbi:MAG: ABC transporter permease [Phycisphaerales bacterium]
MAKLILRRLLQLPLIVLIIYTITLALAWAIPGNPLEKDGRRPKPEIQQAMLRQYNLDSFPRFYVSYLYNASGMRWVTERLDGTASRRVVTANAVGTVAPQDRVFDLGPSLTQENWRVNEIIAASLPVSITLGATAILIALGIGLAAGVIGAVRPNSLADIATLGVSLVGISQPSFVIGTILLIVFCVWMPLFPVGEWSAGGFARGASILPALTLSLPFAAYIARLTRMGMIDVLGADYIRTARAKGLSESRVILKHALKNAFLPVLSYLGPACALAMTGSFVVERVFNVPGIGQHFVNAVLNKDLFVIIGVVLVFSTMLILFNLAVDVLYRWVDPRIE